MSLGIDTYFDSDDNLKLAEMILIIHEQLYQNPRNKTKFVPSLSKLERYSINKTSEKYLERYV
jgi:hypothetical protein